MGVEVCVNLIFEGTEQNAMESMLDVWKCVGMRGGSKLGVNKL